MNPSTHSRAPGMWCILFVIGLLCLESGLFLVFINHWLDTLPYVTIHIGLCATAALPVAWDIWLCSPELNLGNRKIWLLQLPIWAALGGPFGIGIASMLLLSKSVSTASRSADVITGPSSVDLMHSALLDGRLRLEGAHLVRPLFDVIANGTQLEKFDALGLVSKRFSPSLAPTLRRALEDSDGSVRVLAATVVAQQHNVYLKRIGDRQETTQRMPESYRHWAALSSAHFQYAMSGLLDASRTETELSRTTASLLRAQEHASGA